MKHITHIEHLPHTGTYLVRCDQGCNLGATASRPTFDAAVERAALHVIASGILAEDIRV